MNNSILIIDDSEVMREQIIKDLEPFELFAHYYTAEDGLAGFKKLLSVPVDIILCELKMPRIDGFKFLSMLKARPDLMDVPVIILTGVDDNEIMIKGLDQGASDYVTKPFDPKVLAARVRVHLKIKRLQDELVRSNELLLELSNTDHLTGLYNRRFLEKALDYEFLRSTRRGSDLSLIILDIDHFKRVNDTYGHTQGDVVLEKISAQLQNQLKSYDLAARYGGEEFIGVIPDASYTEAFNVAERLRDAVQNLKFDGDLQQLSITISLGVVSVKHPECRSAKDLIKLADDALYRAKAEGRNRVVGDEGASP